MRKSSLLTIVFVLCGWLGLFNLIGSSVSPQAIDANRLYASLHSKFKNLPEKSVFVRAAKGYNQLLATGRLKQSILCIANFNVSANQKRLWIVDVHHKKVLYHSLVSHGKGSGQEYARKFSNDVGSHQSSLGFYITGDTYTGAHGLSLYLDGMEDGINSNARQRAVVIHGASYVSTSFIKKYGRLGRSHGCPALPVSSCEEMIKTIKGGAALYIHADDEKYFETTKF